MILHVRHVTTYMYTDAVSICHNELHLQPRDCPQQTCLFYELLVQPLPAVSSSITDFFGNHVSFIAVQEPHRRLVVTARPIMWNRKKRLMNQIFHIGHSDAPTFAIQPNQERRNTTLRVRIVDGDTTFETLPQERVR